jgi:predicted phosphodiesterase
LPSALEYIVKEAMETSIDDFVQVVDQAAQLLQKEDGAVGLLNILGKHVKIAPLGEAVIISDLHGDLESLIQILQQSDILKRMRENKNTLLIFLGDYGDRGEFSAEIYYTVLQMKLQCPAQVVLMRGNHEGPSDILASPHDLPTQFNSRFGNKWKTAYNKIIRLFPCLYNSVSVEKRYLMVHGGLPEHARTVNDFAYAHETHPKQTFFEELLWSDPLESFSGAYPSPRGAGKLFGKDITDKVLKALDVQILIRGHEPCSEGFQINHEGKILTLFSRKGEPYYNAQGAYLDVSLSPIYENAKQLLPYIHKF